MKRIYKAMEILGVCYLLGSMLAEPETCVSAAKEALRLCAEVVVPSLFPFFVCSNLLIGLGGASILSRYLSPLMRPLFGISGGGALAVVLGVISGYPVGADCVANLYSSGECTKTEAERMLAFCNNSGPLFVIGAVGVGMLHNPKLGSLLYVVHLVSALLTGILFCKFGKENHAPKGLLQADSTRPVAVLGNAVADGVSSVLKVCGFVVTFAVVISAMPKWQGSPFFYALLEITGGLKSLLEQGGLGRFLLPMVSMFLAFSGISVMMQVVSIIQPAGLSLKPYLLGKLVHGIIAFLLTGPMLGFFPQVQEVSVAMPMAVPTITPKAMLLISALSVLWCLVFLALLTLAVWLSERKDSRHKRESELFFPRD